MDLTEAEDIKKRWQEYTELYKKDIHDPDNHNGVITHLEPDILEYEVKLALGSITTNKASGGDRIPVELFQILKDDAVKVLPFPSPGDHRHPGIERRSPTLQANSLPSEPSRKPHLYVQTGRNISGATCSLSPSLVHGWDISGQK